MTDLLVIGSGPAAFSCALTARARDLSVTVVGAKAETGWLWKTESIANYPGMPNVSGRKLLEVFQQQAEDSGAAFIQGVARNVQRFGKTFMTLVGSDIIESRAVVLCMGAARPALLPGEEELIGQGVSWCATCDGMFFRGKEVAVLSAWKGGIEEAEFLSRLASKVDYYTMAPHSVPDDAPYTRVSGKPVSLKRADSRIILTTDEGETTYDGVFIFRPAFAPDRILPGLELNGGFISVDRRMATSFPLVYAAGDCTGKPLQIAKAVGEGNIAAISAAEDLAQQA